MVLSAMSYYGGKSGGLGAASGTGRWVASHVPNDVYCYAEPYAGMCGVLLQLPKHQSEIINDLSGNVYNWWKVVRDQPEELYELLLATPHKCRRTLQEAYDMLQEDHDDVRLAWAFSVAVTMSPLQGITHGMMCVKKASKGAGITTWRHRLRSLSDRIKDVQIENYDAIQLISRLNSPEVFIYCDPPYRHANTSQYTEQTNHDELEERLLGFAGRVLVSGYDGDFPRLQEEWRSERHYTFTAVNRRSTKRTECLWMNYDPPQERLF